MRASRAAVSFPDRRAHDGKSDGSGLGGLRTTALGHTALEALDATTGVDQLLATRVERMTRGAELDVNLRRSRTGRERVPARARDVRLDVIGMNVSLHSY